MAAIHTYTGVLCVSLFDLTDIWGGEEERKERVSLQRKLMCWCCFPSDATCPPAWLSRGHCIDQVCQLQPDPCEKVFYHYFFKVVSFQTQKPLDYSGGVRYQITQHRCSPPKAFLAPVAAGLHASQAFCQHWGGAKFKVVPSCSAESRFS